MYQHTCTLNSLQTKLALYCRGYNLSHLLIHAHTFVRTHTQYFEYDDPELYVSKVHYIKENDVTDLGLVFAEEEFGPDGDNPKVKRGQGWEKELRLCTSS